MYLPINLCAKLISFTNDYHVIYKELKTDPIF